MKLIVICGATATGKSDLAVALAQEINAEIKHSKLGDIKKNAAEVQCDIHNIQKEVAIAEREGQEIKNKLNELKQRQQRINSNNDKISVIQEK